MQQVSPPLRIALVAVLALGALWLVALRPKSAAEPPPEPPTAVQGLAGDVRQARQAKEAADAAAARSRAAAEQGAQRKGASRSGERGAARRTAGGSTAGKATGGAAAGGPAASLIAALDRGRTVVLVLRNGSADSAAVAAAARSRARAGRVVVRVVSIADVGRYAALTRSVGVSQAPTTLVVGPKRRARMIVGFTTGAEIGQAVREVSRRSAR